MEGLLLRWYCTDFETSLARDYCSCAFGTILINIVVDLTGSSRESLVLLSHFVIFHFAMLIVVFCFFYFPQ